MSKEIRECKKHGMTEFSLWGIRWKCLKCQKGYQDKRYKINSKMKKEALVRAKNHKKVNQEYVWEYLLSHPCVDCGETNPVVLEFDHKDDSDKKREISLMLSNGNSLDTIIKEIEKCEVRCANCHRRRTAEQFGWLILEYLKTRVMTND